VVLGVGQLITFFLSLINAFPDFLKSRVLSEHHWA
jgi:hypothetical protein